MMTILFDGKGGISEAPVLGVSQDRTSLTTRVPMDAVTGYVMLIRKRIFSGMSAADTSNTSNNKVTVLAFIGDASDLIMEERFDTDLSRWIAGSGNWRIENGLLVAENPGRLDITLPKPRTEITIYADILNAESFGFSFKPVNSATMFQVWVNLTGTSPALTWSSIDSEGNQTLLEGKPLSLLQGDNYLIKVDIKGGMVSLYLNQEEISAYQMVGESIEIVGLLSSSSLQRRDNVVILRGDYLSLASPEFYRFGTIPEAPDIPPLAIESFTPEKGKEGTQVTLKGIGLDEAAHFFFGGTEADVVEATGNMAKITVPKGAKSGVIEIHGRGGAITATDKPFILPPKISSLIPETILAGQELKIVGTNLPLSPEVVNVQILDQPAEIAATTSSMLTVLVPDVIGKVPVSISYRGFYSRCRQNPDG